MLDVALFASFPYAAVILAVTVGLLRYYKDRYSYSSQSSQFLENRTLFWGSVTWHYGIILILSAHVLALLFPGWWGSLIANQTRLYILEVMGLALAILTIFGLWILTMRRIRIARITSVTTLLDWVIILALLAQVVMGFWIALVYRWGSDWYLHTSVPWLISLIKFQPKVEYVTMLPWMVKAHILGGFVIIALFPFTRLVHLVTFPVTYLWRPYQVVIWNSRRRATR